MINRTSETDLRTCTVATTLAPFCVESAVLSVYLSVRFFLTAVAVFRKPNAIPLFLHWSGSKSLVVMAACTPSIHVFLGRLLFLLSRGIKSIINFGVLSSGILLTWPHHCSLFFSMMSGFPFTPIISFMCSFFIFYSSYSFIIFMFCMEINKNIGTVRFKFFWTVHCDIAMYKQPTNCTLFSLLF